MASHPGAPIDLAPDERCIDHAVRGKCSTRETDLVIARLAERQHGVVARYQLLGAGVGRRSIDERVGRRLHRVHRGVYAVGYRAKRIEGRWMAAVLASGPGAALSHRTAAQLWGLTNRSAHVPEVTRPNGFRGLAGVRAHRARLPEDELTAIDGIPATTAPRTILDMAAVASPRQVERALNELEVRGLTDELSIPDLLAHYPRRRGAAVLRSLLGEGAQARGVTRNDFEELFASLIARHRLLPPRFNADIHAGGRFYCVDCLWQRERLIVELDGRATHGTRRAFEKDRERDRLLLAEGWRVMRVTWNQLNHQPGEIATDLRKALASGRTLHRPRYAGQMQHS